jgi:hypothetical protein
MRMFELTENGVTKLIPLREGLEILNDVQLYGREFVKEASIGSLRADIEYKDGTKFTLVRVEVEVEVEVEVDAEENSGEPAEWSGTYSNQSRMHRFDPDTLRARCNKGIRPAQYLMPSPSGYEWEHSFKTRTELESGEFAHLYRFCPKCESK